MSTEHKAKIRDRRRVGWFSVDDEIIEVFGPQLGVHGIATYCALCKYADKDESSHPGLRTLCDRLKMGRKKLLDTLDLLQRLGLIAIEKGDRVTVNVYTLLDVPKSTGYQQKGGSDENHTPPEGGSGENQGWFQPEPQGGSDENRNQTHREPNPLNQKSREGLSYLDGDMQRAVSALCKIQSFKKPEKEAVRLIGELKDAYPRADAATCCEELEFNVRHGGEKVKVVPTKLRQYFRVSHERASAARSEPRPPAYTEYN